jgi:striatin 1/3/4
MDTERGEDDARRDDLKSYLDQCQAEFTYLMVTPANPAPPRESPPLPGLEDLREGGAFGLPVGQQQSLEQASWREARAQPNNARELNPRPGPTATHQAQPMQSSASGNYAVKNPDLQPAPMVRTSNNELASAMFGNAASEWPAQVSMAGRAVDDANSESSQQLRNMVRPESLAEVAEKKGGMTEADGWDFGEGTFPETSQPQPPQQQQQTSTRPDTDVFPTAENIPKSPNRGALSHRRKNSNSMSRRRSSEHELSLNAVAAQKTESANFKLRFGLRGHLNTVRTIIFSGGGSPGEPEICTADDDGMIKRFHIPAPGADRAPSASGDMDVTADFTHRGHQGAVLSLTSWSPAPNFSTGGRAQGDGWIFSGGKDGTIRVWERGRVDPKATLEGHTDSVWAVCVLPTTLGAIFGPTNLYGTPERILLVSGGADGTVRLWAVSAPPQLTSPQPASNRRGPGGRVRGNSMSSGSQFPSSPQPTIASNSPFHYSLVHKISRSNSDASSTCITPLSPNGESFVVSYSDAAIIVYDTRTGEEIGTMASLETYDETLKTSVNAVVATTAGLDQAHQGGLEDETGGGPTGGGRSMAGSGVEGVIISGHEDRFVRFFDANSGKSLDFAAMPIRLHLY